MENHRTGWQKVIHKGSNGTATSSSIKPLGTDGGPSNGSKAA
ncbi:hypothetical protein JL09_g5044 [Pichia kudriavzevii]|uniref:Uncharacterized protein n=1 Tax=Pichia kudriavzevii TaxID=4909 RepID=A0A099NV70_PICKU|nr:hypothetical protein JL09_g5044 [Pichia kudriavzevii]